MKNLLSTTSMLFFLMNSFAQNRFDSTGVTRPNDIYSQFQNGYKPGKGQNYTDTIFRDQYLKKPNSP